MDLKPYRGPPPRKDLVLSPRREEDWKGNDLFKITTDMNSNSNRDEKQQTVGFTSDVGYGPQKTQRDYGNDYSKLALNGGRKGLLRMDNNEELSEERRQKGCGELSDYSRLARQGGHKDLLVIEENKRTDRVEHHSTSGNWFEYNNNTSASPHRHNMHNSDNTEVKHETIQQPIVRPKQMRINGCLPDGEDLVKKSGKKRFDNSARAHILRMSLNKDNGSIIGTPEFVTQVSAEVQIRALGLDAENGDLYWGDLLNSEIIKLSLNESLKEKLFSYAIGYVTGLAVDASSHILYWVDSLMKLVEASTTKGLYRKVLFKLDRDSEPRAIVLHPTLGYLFWTDWGVSAKIERASLSGTNRVTLVSSDIVWPNDITIDYDTNVLYWIDAYLDVLSSVDLNGGNRKNIDLNYPRPHPFSLVFFNSKIYVSDWTSDSIYLINSASSQKIFELTGALKVVSNKNIGQVKIYAKRTEVNSPCSSNNSCSHLCFTMSPTSFSCGCPIGMILSSDNFTCNSSPKHYEIFFTDSGTNSIYLLTKYVDQDGFTIKPLLVPGMEGIVQYPVAINYDENDLYWTDTKSHKTYRININGSNFETVINHNNHSSIGLAIDHLSKLMFFFDNSDNGDLNLVVSDFNAINVKTLVLNLNNPQDIVYYDGYVFYSDLGSHLIGRINSDGTELITLLNDPQNYQMQPTGLAVDKVEKRLYWCDQYSHLIESSNLDFSERRKIIQKTIFFQNAFWLVNNLGEVLDPFDLIVHHERIYWTDLQKQAIFVADKRSGSNIEYVTGGLNKPMRMIIMGDIPHEEFRKVYLFSFTTLPSSSRSLRCFRQPSCSGNSRSQLSPPALCPLGYIETNYGYSCSNCSDAFGANFKCFCSDWMTCAQRGYADVLGCGPQRPFTEFRVRECTQAVKFGFCPYKSLWDCSTDMLSCLSDQDCNDSSKCCQSACGSKCVPFLLKSDHPCTINNGGCSHICFSSTKWLKCGCPDGMQLVANGKDCQNISKTLVYSSVQSSIVLQSTFDIISFLPKTTVKSNLVATSSMFVVTTTTSSRELCLGILCNNGGSCAVMNKTAKCLCADDWFGSTCQIYTKSELVSISLQAAKQVTKEYLVSSLASYYSQYCSNYTTNCLYDAQKRRRRSIFSEEDVYIRQFEYNNNYLSVDFAIVSETNGVLKKESINAGLTGFLDSMDKSLQIKLVSMSYLKSSATATKRNFTLIGVLICLFIVITILVLLFAFLRFKKRPVRHVVQWSLQNQMFTDVYPHEVSLSTDSFQNSLSYMNPMYTDNNCEKILEKNMTEDDVDMPQDNNYKKQTQQWVQFTNANEVSEKPPIKDFVSLLDCYQADHLNQNVYISSPQANSNFQRSYSVTDLFNDCDVLPTPLNDDYVVLTRPTTAISRPTTAISRPTTATSRVIEVIPSDDSISKEELNSDC